MLFGEDFYPDRRRLSNNPIFFVAPSPRPNNDRKSRDISCSDVSFVLSFVSSLCEALLFVCPVLGGFKDPSYLVIWHFLFCTLLCRRVVVLFVVTHLEHWLLRTPSEEFSNFYFHLFYYTLQLNYFFNPMSPEGGGGGEIPTGTKIGQGFCDLKSNLVVDVSGQLCDISMLRSKIMPVLSKPGRKSPKIYRRKFHDTLTTSIGTWLRLFGLSVMFRPPWGTLPSFSPSRHFQGILWHWGHMAPLWG